MDQQAKASTIAILTSALHNTGVVQDQLKSLDDDYPMPEVIEQMQEGIDAIQAELDKLNA